MTLSCMYSHLQGCSLAPQILHCYLLLVHWEPAEIVEIENQRLLAPLRTRDQFFGPLWLTFTCFSQALTGLSRGDFCHLCESYLFSSLCRSSLLHQKPGCMVQCSEITYIAENKKIASSSIKRQSTKAKVIIRTSDH